MKKKFLCLAVSLLLALVAYGEVKEQHATFPYYEYVVSSNGTPADLKNKVLNWSKTEYDRTEFYVIEEGDAVVIDGKSWISKGEMGVCPVTFHFTMKFEFKDGRFKNVTRVTKAMVQDGMLPRVLDRMKYYTSETNNSRNRARDLEIFHQKLLKWIEDISTTSAEQPNSDW